MDPTPTLDELDAATLTELLRRHDPTGPQPVVVEVRAEPLGATTGFLGQLRRLHLTYAPELPAGPARLVAKAPTEDAGGRQVGAMLDVWARESRFFADLAPQLPCRVPRCYANLGDRGEDAWLLLLEDVGDTTAASQSEGASKEHASAALGEIARLHRHFEATRPTSWLPGFDRGPLTGLQASVEQAVEPFLDRFADLLPAGGAQRLRRFAPQLADWAQVQAASPLTLVHADYRLDNLIIGPSNDVVILDWQTALLGGGAMDVASFLATSLSVEHRRDWEEELMALYAAEVGHTVEHVRRGVGQYLLWWMALYAHNLSRIEPSDPAGAAMFEHTVQRTFVAAADHVVGGHAAGG